MVDSSFDISKFTEFYFYQYKAAKFKNIFIRLFIQLKIRWQIRWKK